MKLEATLIYKDNQTCIKMTKNDADQERTKHIKTQHHFSRQAVKSGEVKLIHCPTELMLADALTTALSEIKFAKLGALIPIQGTRLNQSGSVEDQASVARLVLKQAEGKHQFSKARADPDASIKYSDSFHHISFKLQQGFLRNLQTICSTISCLIVKLRILARTRSTNKFGRSQEIH